MPANEDESEGRAAAECEADSDTGVSSYAPRRPPEGHVTDAAAATVTAFGKVRAKEEDEEVDEEIFGREIGSCSPARSVENIACEVSDVRDIMSARRFDSH